MGHQGQTPLISVGDWISKNFFVLRIAQDDEEEPPPEDAPRRRKSLPEVKSHDPESPASAKCPPRPRLHIGALCVKDSTEFDEFFKNLNSKTYNYLPNLDVEEQWDVIDEEECSVDLITFDETDTDTVERNWMQEDETLIFAKLYCKVLDTPTVEIKVTEVVAPVTGGDSLEVVRVQPWPVGEQELHNGPIFAVMSTLQAYEDMQRNMYKLYFHTLKNAVKFPIRQLLAERYVVYYMKDEQTAKMYQRAKIVSIFCPEGKASKSVVLNLIDCGTIVTVDCTNLLYLYEAFSKLPSKIIHFELEGLSFYRELNAFKGLMMQSSGLWDGRLRIRKFTDDGFVVYSHVTKNFIYGINQFILTRLKFELPQSFPSKVGELADGCVMHDSENGDLLVQFKSPFLDHYIYLFDKYFAIINGHGSKSKVEPFLKVGTLVFAPYRDNFYRGRIKSIDKISNRVWVKFIDDGDETEVLKCETILARNIHPFFEIFPTMANIVRLYGLNNSKETRVNWNPLWNFLENDENKFVSFKVLELDSDGTPLVKLIRETTSKNGRSPRCIIFDGTHINSNKKPKIKNMKLLPDVIPSKELLDVSVARFDIIQSRDGEREECLFYREGKYVRFRIVGESGQHVNVLPERILSYLQTKEEYWEENFLTYSEPIQYWNWMMVLARSKNLGKIARGMLILEKSDKKSTEVNVFFLDYGIKESLRWDCVRRMPIEDCQMFACGSKALLSFNGELLLSEDIEKHWGMDCLIVGKVTDVIFTLEYDLQVIWIEVRNFIPPSSRTNSTASRLFENDGLFV